jgi:hypothetical protein
MSFLAVCAIISVIIGVVTLYYLAVVKPVDDEINEKTRRN